jgi:hypothetical protein
MKVIKVHNVYRIVNATETTIYFEGSKSECESMLEDMLYEDMAHTAFYSFEK